jgi:hypothetical protein
MTIIDDENLIALTLFNGENYIVLMYVYFMYVVFMYCKSIVGVSYSCKNNAIIVRAKCDSRFIHQSVIDIFLFNTSLHLSNNVKIFRLF